MLQHNLLLIYRTFKRFKSLFFINLIGLSAGLACALSIYLWVNDELNFDKFHKKNSQLFQVMQNVKNSDQIVTLDITPGPLAEALIAEMPEVEYVAADFNASILGKSTLVVKDRIIKASGLYASKDYFNVFTYNLIQGDENQALSHNNSIVISNDLALKLFKTTKDIVGKALEFDRETEFTISGIFEGTPSNSSAQFDFVLPLEVIKQKYSSFTSWGNNNVNTYVILKKGTNIQQFNSKIANLIEMKNGETTRTLFLKPYSEKYLYGNYKNGVQDGGRIEYVKLFSLIAVFILIIACINFMNLSTARASRRMKEVGIKKAIGVNRLVLVFQYLGESTLMSFLALIVAIFLVVLFLPSFNEITGKHITMSLNANLIFTALGITLFTGFVAGSYPALFLSGFNPAAILKDKLDSSVSELWVRKGLVVFQFTLSIILIVCVLVIYKQIQLIQTKNPGYDKDNIIYFDKEGEVFNNQDYFLSELKKIPGVVNAASTGFSIVGSYNTTGGVSWAGKKSDDIVDFEIEAVGYDLIETLGIQMDKGRTFSKDFGADKTNVIFNESAIEAMGLEDPIGKVVNIWGQDMQIIGVTKNFHFESLHKKVNPLFFMLMPDRTLKIFVKIKAGSEKETINKLQNFYQNFNPGFNLDYKFLDEDFQAQYVSEKRIAFLSRCFTLLAILISCLGVSGLAAFTAERRFKEIGIRKALGSSNFNIVYLLSSDFTVIVLVSIIIALPLSYIVTKHWLNNFAYKIDLRFWYFIGAGFIALLVTWIIVGMQAIKATKINLVECLKLNE